MDILNKLINVEKGIYELLSKIDFNIFTIEERQMYHCLLLTEKLLFLQISQLDEETYIKINQYLCDSFQPEESEYMFISCTANSDELCIARINDLMQEYILGINGKEAFVNYQKYGSLIQQQKLQNCDEIIDGIYYFVEPYYFNLLTNAYYNNIVYYLKAKNKDKDVLKNMIFINHSLENKLIREDFKITSIDTTSLKMELKKLPIFGKEIISSYNDMLEESYEVAYDNYLQACEDKNRELKKKYKMLLSFYTCDMPISKATDYKACCADELYGNMISKSTFNGIFDAYEEGFNIASFITK